MMRNAQFIGQGLSRNRGVRDSDKFGSRDLGNRAGVATADETASNNCQADRRYCVHTGKRAPSFRLTNRVKR